jgi:hypothetical protein
MLHAAQQLSENETMKIKLIIAAMAASILGGCVIVPEGHRHHGWHGDGYGHRHWERQHYRW